MRSAIRWLGIGACLLAACRDKPSLPKNEPPEAAPVQPVRAAPPGLRVYVSNEDSGDVSVIDAANDVELRRVAVGKRPRGLRLSPDETRLYVAVSGSAKVPPGSDEKSAPPPDRKADGIVVIDLTTHRVVQTIESGADPESFDVTPDGQRLYVSNEDASEASVLDARKGVRIGAVKVGDEPEGVTMRPDGAVVYVTSEEDNRIDVIDVARNEAILQVPTGLRPRVVLFTPDNAKAYVSNELSSSIQILDAQRHLSLGDIPITVEGARPMGLALSPDGLQLFVATGRGGSVAYVDPASRKVTRTVPAVGKRPWGLGITPDGAKLYTANGPSNDVSVIQVSTGKVAKRIGVGASPWGIAVSRKPHADGPSAASAPPGTRVLGDGGAAQIGTSRPKMLAPESGHAK